MTVRSSSTTGLRLARWYLAAVGALLLGIGGVTVASHVAQAMEGITLVFSQEAMDDVALGPAPTAPDEPTATPGPVPAAEASGGVQYVDLTSLGLTLAGGLVAAAGALMLLRGSAWSVPLGLAGSLVGAVVGLFPALIAIWAAGFYEMTSIGQMVPYLLVSATLVAVAAACGVTIWRHRSALAPR